MAGAFWCVVEDDRQGRPKKVMAEVLGEASRLAGQMGSQAEAVWLTDKAIPEGYCTIRGGSPGNPPRSVRAGARDRRTHSARGR